VAVLAACGSDDADQQADIAAGSTAEARPAPAATASVEPEQTPTEPAPTRPPEIRDPAEVRIPSIGVTAPVVPITMTPDLVLDPPADPAVIGWWSEGVAPGARQGSAVLVGHATRAGTGGAFDEVGTLSDGDTIEVEGSAATLTYRVESVEVVSKDDLARRAEEIFNQSGPGRLVVITCEDWDGTSWRSNIVTVATLA
jgi:LPXTG-site transpeptidase (sortase) family protein